MIYSIYFTLRQIIELSVKYFDSRCIYFSNSTIAGADEGLFAKRDFQPGDLISYYGGKRDCKRFEV